MTMGPSLQMFIPDLLSPHTYAFGTHLSEVLPRAKSTLTQHMNELKRLVASGEKSIIPVSHIA